MDVRKIIARLIDDGELLEIQAGFARNLIIGFARIEGMVVGLVANQSTEMAGALDINAACKGARFIRFCNIFNIPLVTLVDVPGFLPGIEQERGAIIRHGAKLLFAYASCTTPKISVILRKAYGDSYLAMCSQEMGADFVYAWPTAEIAVMGAEGAVNILYRKELSEAADRREKVAQLAAQYRAEFASPYSAAKHGYITDVIEPSETRGLLALSLRKVIGKREQRPGEARQYPAVTLRRRPAAWAQAKTLRIRQGARCTSARNFRHDPLPVERTLHNMADALSKSGKRASRMKEAVKNSGRASHVWSAYFVQGQFSSSQLLPNHVCSLGKQKMGASPARLRLNGFFRF